MRFNVQLSLEKEKISKDKNRIFISLLKNNFNSYNKDYYTHLYKEVPNKIKNYTFALYMPGCKFLRDNIIIPDKKIILNYSTNDYEDGIMFFNAFLSNKGKEFPIKDNKIIIQKVNIVQEQPIYDSSIVFKTLSPIVVREHMGDNRKTWYHSLNTEKGQAIFLENIKYQLKDVFGDRVVYDFNDIVIEVSNENKEVKVKNYGIEVLSNITKLKVTAKPYILDYFYKAGIGSKRGSGFGMLDIV